MSNLKYIPILKLTNSTQRMLQKIAATQFLGMSDACYYPKLKRYYNDVTYKLGINKQDIQKFSKESLGGVTKKFQSFTKPLNLVCIIGMLNSAEQNDREFYETFAHILTINMYVSAVHIFFPKFCSKPAFKHALETIYHKHLFRRQKGIEHAVRFIAEQESMKYFTKMSNGTVTDIELAKMFYAIRTRIIQSCKSFAKRYYETLETSELDNTPEIVIKQKITDMVSELCTYNIIHQKILMLAIKYSNIDPISAKNILESLADGAFTKDVLFICILLNKMLNFSKIKQNDKSRIQLITKVLKGEKIQNYSIKKEIEALITKLPNSYLYSNMHSAILVNFICQYLLLTFKFKF